MSRILAGKHTGNKVLQGQDKQQKDLITHVWLFGCLVVLLVVDVVVDDHDVLYQLGGVVIHYFCMSHSVFLLSL